MTQQDAQPWYRSEAATKLDELVRAYDRQAAEDHPAASAPPPDWRAEYISFRETYLRPALEAVAWKLEQHDHHPWLEDLEPVPASSVSRPSHGRGSPRPVGDFGGSEAQPAAIRLRFVVGGEEQAPARIGRRGGSLLFEPRADLGKVEVIAQLQSDQVQQVADELYRLDELSEEAVLEMAADLVRRALFGEAIPPRLEEVALPESDDEQRAEVETDEEPSGPAPTWSTADLPRIGAGSSRVIDDLLTTHRTRGRG